MIISYNNKKAGKSRNVNIMIERNEEQNKL